MSKTLVVTYLPKGENSNTKKLLDPFLNSIKSKTEIIHLDLINDIPQIFTDKNLLAYTQRNYGGKELTEQESQMLATADRHCQMLMEADNVVLASPVHNFSMPAIVKAWIDGVLQNGKTFAFGPNGLLEPMKGKKALAIYTAGMLYNADMHNLDWDTYKLVFNANFRFMGFSEVKSIAALGSNMLGAEEFNKVVEEKLAELEVISKEWF